MGFIALPQRQLSQPQHLTPLDRSHWAYPDIVFAYSAGRGFQEARYGGVGAITGAVSERAGPKGKSIVPSNSTSYAAFPHVADYNTLGEVTMIAAIHTTTVMVSQQAVMSKIETGGGSNTPWALLVEGGAKPAINRSNAGGFRVWASPAVLTDNTAYVIAATQGGNIGTAPLFYVNGVATGAATNLYGGGGSGAATGNTVSAKLGNRTDLAAQSSTWLYDGVVLKRVLTPGEITELSTNLAAIWQAEPFGIWLEDAVITPSTFQAAWAHSSNVILGAGI